MRIRLNAWTASLFLGAAILAATPESAHAQGRKKADTAPATNERLEKIDTAPVTTSVRISPEEQVRIRDYYVDHRGRGVESLPPGIRKRLARGKPLPPGIAKRPVPRVLRSSIRLRSGYELIEIGLDVILVEVATGVVQDLVRDVVR
jgi:hypothetical protein